MEESDTGSASQPKKNRPRKAPKAKARPRRPATVKEKTTPRATSESAAERAAKLAANLVDFEKTTFASATALLRSINDQSEKAIRHALSNATWVPKEGQKLVEEWQATLRHSLKDFSKTVDKSFDLMSKYLARVRAESAKGEK